MVSLWSWLKSTSLMSIILSLLNKQQNYPGTCPFPKETVFCMNEAISTLPQCQLGQVEESNLRNYFVLERLLHEPFFRYFKVLSLFFIILLYFFKVNLKKPCPFWDAAMFCFSDQCAIDVLSEEPEFIPKAQPLLSGEMDTLNDVKFPKFQQVKHLIFHL